MARLPNTVKDLCKIEKISVKSYETDKINNLIDVVADDGREFLVFAQKRDAFNYAVKVFEDNTDDPQYLMQIKFTQKTVKEYAEELVERKDVPHVLSYDQHHKVRLPNEALAYRTI